MKKILMIIAVVGMLFSLNTSANAEMALSAKKKKCPGDGKCYVVAEGGGMKVWRVGNPNKVYDESISLQVNYQPDQMQALNYFIPDDPNNPNGNGEGVKKGLVLYTDKSQEALFYIFEYSEVFNKYSDWDSAVK